MHVKGKPYTKVSRRKKDGHYQAILQDYSPFEMNYQFGGLVTTLLMFIMENVH